jgi:hypothetical protein
VQKQGVSEISNNVCVTENLSHLYCKHHRQDATLKLSSVVRKLKNLTHLYSQLQTFISYVKLFLCLTNYTLRHQGVWGSGSTYPRTLVFGTSWRWMVSFTPRPLYRRGNSPRNPLNRRLGGLQSRSGQFQEKILNSTRTRTPTPRSAWARTLLKEYNRMHNKPSVRSECCVASWIHKIMRGG